MKKNITFWFCSMVLLIGFHQFGYNLQYEIPIIGNLSNKSSSSADSNDDEGSDHEVTVTNELMVNCSESFLPKKIYSVVGLESSGTTFVTDVLRQALNLTEFRDGHAPTKRPGSSDNHDVQVQHVSFPWGSWCTDTTTKNTVIDVVLPQQCTKSMQNQRLNENVKQCCNSLAEHAFGYKSNDEPIRYPGRYSLNIAKHKEFYDAHGVDQWVIIVLRDPDISVASRYKSNHCRVKELLEAEERVGKAIISDTINKYILDNDERQVTPENFEHWTITTQNQLRRRLNLRGIETDAALSSVIPAKNNVVIVSYESMVFLGDQYFEMLFKTLDIQTNFIPSVKNGNSKYVQHPF